MGQFIQVFDLKINVCYCDLYFMVHWFCLISQRLFYEWVSYFQIMKKCDPNLNIFKIIWWMNIIIWDYESVWPDAWPQNKCRSLWPIFHGPVILCYILKTIWCMNIILGDYGSVSPDVWPKNKCMSLWPVFHDPLILPYISKTVWWMNVIFSDNEKVWPKPLPQNKCRSTWPVFHSLVILLNLVKIFW